MATQAEILRERYRTLQQGGALDIKFCFGPLAEETDEGICQSVNEALAAYMDGKYETLPPTGDSRIRG